MLNSPEEIGEAAPFFFHKIDMIETALTLEGLVQKTKIKFEEHYGRPARWIVAAPGRVNIIGEHTDYNGGFVFPMGIEIYRSSSRLTEKTSQ